MRVQNISNTQNFKGGVFIRSNLNPALEKTIKNSLKDINLGNKPFSLAIENPVKGDFLSIVARNDFGKEEKKYTVLVHRLSQKPAVITDAVHEAVNKYEALYPATFTEKSKVFFNKLGKRIFEIITDEE